MTPVVIDASAGVELAADTVRGRALRALLAADAGAWVPEHFFVECGAVLRLWDLNQILTPTQAGQAIDELAWPLRVTQVRGLFADDWRLRANVTFADALYVAPICCRTMSGWPTRPVYRFACCACRKRGLCSS